MLKYRDSVLIANQMDITDKINVIPQANHLFVSLLTELSYRNNRSIGKRVNTYILDGDEYDSFEEIKENVKQGADLLINNLTDNNVKCWNDLIGTEIKLLKRMIYSIAE